MVNLRVLVLLGELLGPLEFVVRVLSVIPIRCGKYHEQEMFTEVRKARHVDLDS